jgi:hypothetical protein
LSECIKIHAGLLASVRRMIPLHRRREPDLCDVINTFK